MGIDPGLATTGWGVIKILRQNKISMIDYGCIKTSKKHDFSQRLSQIYKEMIVLIKKYKPDKIAIENLYFAKNVKTAMKVSEARGVIILATTTANAKVFGFTPLQIKAGLTGYGQATKSQVQKMVTIRLNLKKTPKPDDAADALAVAIVCSQTKEHLK